MHTNLPSPEGPTGDITIITSADGVMAQEEDNLMPLQIQRPWSSHDIKVAISPSPQYSQPSRTSKDDTYTIPSPTTPKRTSFPTTRGLSLQMPPRDVSSTSTANLSKRIPSSPKYELGAPWTSPGSAVPRRSRGMDFSRACTNLHHSTLAEQSSPDSSPTIGGRGMFMPQRRGFLTGSSVSNMPESPSGAPHTLWSALEKSGLPSSLGSVGAIEHDSESSSSSDDEAMLHNEEDETIHPALPSQDPNGPNSESFRAYSYPAAKMMSYQRARIKKPRRRKPLPGFSVDSPPVLRSVESSLRGTSAEDPTKSQIQSRRQSLSLGTHDLQLSDGEGSDEASARPRQSLGLAISTMNPQGDNGANVVRKTVHRRSNMLPKPKILHRIQVALQDEATPIETEVSREAEVIRQVRESDNANSICVAPSQPTTTASSPYILPATAGPNDGSGSGEISEDVTMASEISAASRRSSSTFSFQATRSSTSLGLWNVTDERTRTPPPFIAPRGSSSGVSDDFHMETPLSSINSMTPHQSTTKHDVQQQPPTMYTSTVMEFPIKKGNKRVRDDDWDILHFKRRAVSPGMSLQNSPILPQSPLSNHGWAGQWPKGSHTSQQYQQQYHEVPGGSQVIGDRISSGGSVSSSSNGANGNGVATPRRVGLQGMNDTSDGFMGMSIE